MPQSLGGFGRISKILVLSYFLDWIVLIAFGLITYGLNKINPNYHPFSLLDLSISYPYKQELVSTTYLVLASVIGPAVIIFLVSGILVPGPQALKSVSKGLLLRRKIWELNAGWLGLGLSEMIALLVTTGLKNAFGKPRPNMLARCQPDTSLESIQQHAVGSYASGYSSYWVLVDVGVCTQTNPSALNDGFRSFPSGHASTAWSGLLYLSLYLCAKLAVGFPFLGHHAKKHKRPGRPESSVQDRDSATEQRASPSMQSNSQSTLLRGRRNEAAAPPLYLLFALIVPIGVASYISASRWFDYRHHGFDIISGALIGALASWFSFRLYQMPLGRGSGWAWGPRSPQSALGIGVGTDGWTTPDESPQQQANPEDLEMGPLRQQRDSQNESRSVSLEGRDSGPQAMLEPRGYASLPASDGASTKKSRQDGNRSLAHA